MIAPLLTGDRCQCAGCDRVFVCLETFDLHQVGAYAKPGEYKGSRRCMTAAEMAEPGWDRNDDGCWLRVGGLRADGMPFAVFETLIQQLLREAQPPSVPPEVSQAIQAQALAVGEVTP